MTQTTQPFEELFIPRKDFNSNAVMLYRVYSDYKHYEIVEADSALNALGLCKIKTAYKVQRHDPLGDNVIHFNQVLNMEAKNSLAVAPVVQEVPVAAAPIVVSAPAEAAALSNDDIDKLLNS